MGNTLVSEHGYLCAAAMTAVIFRRTRDGATVSTKEAGVGRRSMENLEQRIAQVAQELKRLEEEMRREGLAASPELARARHWELSRSVASLYQRWHDFMFLRFAQPAPAYRHAGRPVTQAPRPD